MDVKTSTKLVAKKKGRVTTARVKSSCYLRITVCAVEGHKISILNSVGIG